MATPDLKPLEVEHITVWITAVAALAAAIIGGFIGAYGKYYFDKRREREARREDARFTVYLRLMDLERLLFQSAADEVAADATDLPLDEHPEPPTQETAPQPGPRIDEAKQVLRDEITMNIRIADAEPPLDEVLRFIWTITPNATLARVRELNRLIAKLGETCSPKVHKILAEIRGQNQQTISDALRTR